jgi:hypothetical protein
VSQLGAAKSEALLQAARDKAAKALAEVDELVDSDVPAAVVCARCGNADCPGCLNALMRSGFVAVVPWERPGIPLLVRLWTTAAATTLEAEPFFESLPDGPMAPALRFAIVSELVASAAIMLFALVPLAILAPAWLKHIAVDDGLFVARLVTVCIPSLAMLLVAAHAAHGWALDRGARGSGAPGQTTRALRFGLYAAGWDLVLGPLGVIVVAVKHGVMKGLGVAGIGIGLPGRSARAFLRGCYRLDGKAAEPALRASFIAAALATLFSTIAIFGAAVIALVLSA